MLPLPPPRKKLVVVDRDDRLFGDVSPVFAQEGFDLVLATCGRSLDRILSLGGVDIILLERTMPDECGLSICRRLRAARNETPIIMLKADCQDIDRIVGLDDGADDYLGKPVNARELLARVHALLRRVRATPPVARAVLEPLAPLCFGPFVLDFETRVLLKHGEPVRLTHSNFVMLRALARHPRQVLSREAIASLIRGHRRPKDNGSRSRTPDVEISRLRRRLGSDLLSQRYIQTVWGIGYVFVPDGESYRAP